jgi:hypothetical protein
VNNQINGLSAVNSALNANGAFVISTGGADTTDGNSWTLVDPTALAVTCGGTFSVADFTEDTPGV